MGRWIQLIKRIAVKENCSNNLACSEMVLPDKKMGVHVNAIFGFKTVAYFFNV